MTTVRDKLWIWGHEAGSHTTAEWGVPEPSRIARMPRIRAVEGAVYMGVPNVIMVRYGGKPEPPYHQAAVPFCALGNVVWSIVGAGGTNQDEELGHVLELADELPNLTGVMMDDFFLDPAEHDEPAVLSLDQLRAIRKRLALPKRTLDLYAVLYDHQLEFPVAEHLALCDKVTFWTSRSEHLVDLERNMGAVERLAPSCGKLLGCYMFDYEPHRLMPLDRMERQCTLALDWLRQGRIEGIIVLATCICDLDLDAVEWTRRWIAQVADEEL